MKMPRYGRLSPRTFEEQPQSCPKLTNKLHSNSLSLLFQCCGVNYLSAGSLVLVHRFCISVLSSPTVLVVLRRTDSEHVKCRVQLIPFKKEEENGIISSLSIHSSLFIKWLYYPFCSRHGLWPWLFPCGSRSTTYTPI